MKTKENTDFTNVKEGDTVIMVRSCYGEVDRFILTITRITITRISVNYLFNKTPCTATFYKKDGYELGGTNRRIFIPTTEQIEEVRQENKKKILFNRIRDIILAKKVELRENLSIEDFENIYNIMTKQ